MQTRSDNYQQRISIERRVLQLINKREDCAVPLAGLTNPAIQQWKRQAGMRMQHQEVLALLIEISARLNVEADKSRQVFDSKPLPSSLSELVNEMEILLSEPSSAGGNKL